MFRAGRCFRTERIWCSQELSSRNPASQGLLSFDSPSGGRRWVAFPAHALSCACRFYTAASVAQARTTSRAATPWPWRTCHPRITTPSCRWRTWRILSQSNFIHQQNWATCLLLKRVRLFRLFIAVGSRRENGSRLWVLAVLFSKKLVVAIWVSAVFCDIKSFVPRFFFLCPPLSSPIWVEFYRLEDLWEAEIPTHSPLSVPKEFFLSWGNRIQAEGLTVCGLGVL